MDYTDNTPKGAGSFSLPRRSYLLFLVLGLDFLTLMIALARLIIAVTRPIIIIRVSIFCLLSCVFPFGIYILAYSAEYVNKKRGKYAERYNNFLCFRVIRRGLHHSCNMPAMIAARTVVATPRIKLMIRLAHIS